MKQHHLDLAKYWAATARSFSVAGYQHMTTLFTRYSAEHTAAAALYEN